MIGTTHLFLTHTYLDRTLRNAIAYSYLQQLSSGLQPRTIWELFSSQRSHMIEQAKNIYDSALNTQALLIPTLKTKDEYKDFFVDLYTKHSKPVVLLLGDLSRIDETAQEGMLKVLEEPPEHVTLVLFSHHSASIKPTILSRSVLHTFPLNLAIQILDQEIAEATKLLLPNYRDTLQKIIKHQPVELTKDLKKIEREHIDFWLWQLSYYIEQLGLQQTEHLTHLRERLAAVLYTAYLNSGNLQKKLLFEQISLPVSNNFNPL